MALNTQLYSLLLQRLGKVRIIKEDERASGYYKKNVLTNRLEYEPDNRGEQYGVNCPYCEDTKQRLYFSHRWGVYDDTTHSFNYNLANCWNENCLEVDPTNRSELIDLVFGHMNRNQKKDISLKTSDKTVDNVRAIMPGRIALLQDLDADHRANVYLRSRGFDPVELSQNYKVCFCYDADERFSMAENRIIIPIYMRDELKGWQARYIGERNWKASRFPKYYTMQGTPIRNCLYNFDIAKDYPYVVICEGPSDVWAVGPSAVAIFGKVIKSKQKEMISSVWGNKIVILLLDPDAESESIIQCEELKQNISGKVVKVTLSEGIDAGSCSRDYLWSVIRGAANKQKVKLPR